MEDFNMSIRTKCISLFYILVSGFIFPGQYSAQAADSLTLYTPYTKISVPPGESIDYSIDVINDGNAPVTVDISVWGMPRGWDYLLKAGGWNVKQLSVLPGQKKTLTLQVEVPLKVNKGNYRFQVLAGQLGRLSLVVNVSEMGTFKTEFTTEQANMEGHAESNFTFRTTLRNRTPDKQLYSLRADVPRGWRVTFKPNYQQATSVEIEANTSTDISIEVKPPAIIEAGTYKIPVQAVTKASSAKLELEVVITGTYDMELTTPTGLLSTSITAGNEKRVELLVRNTGSSELTDIKFSSSSPVNWEVVFDPDKIDLLEAGGNAKTMATIKASEKAIAGDYVTNMTARTPEVTARAAFRISVKTPMLWGWIGVGIIIVALGSVIYLFRKYGRR
jgi:uncharacterized membrane protein